MCSLFIKSVMTLMDMWIFISIFSSGILEDLVTASPVVCNSCASLCLRLSEVSPVVRKAVETPASVEYLNTLMKELGLQEQDLLNLVHLFKSPTHRHTH